MCGRVRRVSARRAASRVALGQRSTQDPPPEVRLRPWGARALTVGVLPGGSGPAVTEHCRDRRHAGRPHLCLSSPQ